MTATIRFFVNDHAVSCTQSKADMTLLDFLQEKLDLTGTKFACGIGQCRACTVAIKRSSKAALEKTTSCTTTVSTLQGVHVYTVESLGSAEKLAPLQQAMLNHFSFQCGYCTPGFLMAASVMLEQLKQQPVPAAKLDEFILEAMGDNICRCTGYVRYLEAIREVALPYAKG